MSLNSSGFPAVRQAFTEQQDIAEEINEIRSSSPLPFFQLAVVTEVIYDPFSLTKEEKDDFRNRVNTPELIEKLPIKSILGRIITRSSDRSGNKENIFFPVNSHNLPPVKPGEQVLVFFLDPNKSTSLGFWMCKMTEILQVDDLNYTHADRKYNTNIERPTSERFDGADSEYQPDFPNGDGENEDSFTLSGKNKAYDDILNSSKANQLIVNEPVPRHRPRPSDHTIQGSNNTRITLGMDRIASSNEIPVERSGAIDIVVGASPSGSPNEPNSIKNTRGQFEVDKDPEKTGRKNNLSEGDYDFQNDVCRIYISMLTDVDKNFNIEVSGIDQSGQGAAGLLKVDQVRIVARQDVKLVTESGSAIVMKANGDIVFLPSETALIKLGGDDANLVPLCAPAVSSVGGTTLGKPITSTMGGVTGIGADAGIFGRKVLIK